MKTIQEQKAFQFSSLFVAACLVAPIAIYNYTDMYIFNEQLTFGLNSLIFLGFIYWFNNRIKKYNGFISSYLTTYVSYTLLTITYNLFFSIINNDLSFENYFQNIGMFLIFGYVFNLIISLVVYVFYKSIMYLNNLK